MHRKFLAVHLLVTILLIITFNSTAYSIGGSGGSGGGGSDESDEASLIERGQYLVKITGCNDCHSPGYNESSGTLPLSQWLIGSNVGFKGPWGTTYPINLRHAIAGLTVEEWVSYAQSFKAKPPMPWFNVNAITSDDLRAMYAFVRSLGDSTNEVPEELPPGQVPTTPYINFDVVFPKVN